MKKVTTLLVVLSALLLFGLTAQAGDIKSAGVKGTWSTPATWVGGVVPGATDNVTIADNDTVTIDVSATVANLTVGEGTVGAFLFNRATSVKLTINGNLLVKSGAAFKVQTRPTGGLPDVIDTLVITGNLTNQGSAFDLRAGSAGSTLAVCNVVFMGSGNSIVTMGPYTSSNNEFNGIWINKSGTGRIVLASDMECAGGSSSQPTGDPICTFTQGVIETGQFAFVHTWTSSSAIAGASDVSYVLGAMGRAMSNSAGSDRTFQVGDAKGYRPVKVRSTTSGSSTGHYVRVQDIYGNAKAASSTFAGGIDKVSAVRYCRITYVQGPGAPDMTFDRVSPAYGADDGVAAGNQNLRAATADSARLVWTGQGPVVTPYTTALDSLPRMINADPFATTIKLVNGASMYMALARATGTTENSLGGATAVEKISDLPTSFALEQNYPNPFNPSTNLTFSLAKSGMVVLKVYDALGREIATLLNEEKAAGKYVTTWDASRFVSGVYYCRLQSGGLTETKKMVLVK